jgi:hypothetical protein
MEPLNYSVISYVFRFRLFDCCMRSVAWSRLPQEINDPSQRTRRQMVWSIGASGREWPLSLGLCPAVQCEVQQKEQDVHCIKLLVLNSTIVYSLSSHKC